MSRSLKKGPYINVNLESKVLAMNESGKKSVVKTWARASMISPDFVEGIQLQFITEINLFLFTLQEKHGRTSWANLHQHVHSVAMPVTRKNKQDNLKK